MSASISAIACFLDCQLKYEFRYQRRLPVVGEVLQLELGIAIHAGMEFACNHYREHRHWPTDREAGDVAAGYLARRIAGLATDTVAAARASVQAGLNYCRGLEISEVLGVEIKIKPEFQSRLGQLWDPNGVIDFVYRDRYGAIVVIDWKSCATLGESTTGMLDLQTALYAWWVLRTYDATSVEAGRVYLRASVPAVKVTTGKKDGTGQRVSKTSPISPEIYAAYVDEHPEHVIDDPSFPRWWRADLDVVTERSCAAILEQAVLVDQAIQRRGPPLINARPKFCIRCEYRDPCADHVRAGYEETT